MRLLTTILTALTLSATQAAASGATFAPPEGCAAFLTVQARSCRVSHHYRCAQDPAGDQWRVDFDQEGMFFSTRTDHETQWIESFELFPTVRQTLDPNPADPASFSGLLATGLDSYDFRLSRDNGERTRVTGFDRLTGQSVAIDGVTLRETEFQFAERDLSGRLLRQAQGHEFIHADWRLFFAGLTQWQEGGRPTVAVDGRPVDFIFPGEPGFLATEPLYDCDAMMSDAAPDARIWRANHDR